ncbi:hypothetical protein G195_010731 [Phytophthora kernoviae 00238/432]|uniref:Necrosis inducing-like protein NPP1 type n=1 Tax=Phytophthora kernoviae 00238/432 TaxID=1284355 RepID=A0A8J4W861_9STRA|nr:hypothetical protein G195_010731 [Phytophthora kernoviae 00238/432]
MNLRAIVFIVTAAPFVAIDAISIDHDKVQSFPQPEPVTDSEKAAVKFKPQLTIHIGCAPYPAIYGRAAWHNDIWAIMYAWYFPKRFWLDAPIRRHSWKNVVIWIDNPALETPKILGISTDQGSGYGKIAPVSKFDIINGTAPKFGVSTAPYVSDGYLYSTSEDGDSQDLIMWEQLTDAARAALETADFGRADVPFIDDKFSEELEDAWPF